MTLRSWHSYCNSSPS